MDDFTNSCILATNKPIATRHRFSSSRCRIRECCKTLAGASFRLRIVDLTLGCRIRPSATAPGTEDVVVTVEDEVEDVVAVVVGIELKAGVGMAVSVLLTGSTRVVAGPKTLG